jgi:hypothetical protein
VASDSDQSGARRPEDQAEQAAAALRQLRPARGFRGIGVPSWADISVMVVLAPIEVLLLTALFTGVVLVPLRALLGQGNALVASLEDSFPSFRVESGEEV